jgi:carbamoyl-phosphate synthase large subunit
MVPGKMVKIRDMEKALAPGTLDDALYLSAKRTGYTDTAITRISGQKIAHPRRSVYKMVDTCAAEFEAQTPYFYATCDDENEAAEFIARKNSGKKRVIVFGSGPIRIGQGIEFDYASVHCVWTLKKWVMKSSWSTITRKRFPRTLTPPIACILSRCAPTTSWT